MVAYFEHLASKQTMREHIFAIEEPETYLHPSAQEDLLKSIIKISENSQFFITTHSPIFAGATNGENSILVSKNASGVSQYNRGSEDIIQKIISELGIKPDHNLIRECKFLVFAEGADDVKFLNIAARTLLDKDLSKDGIVCLIGGGSSLSNYADLDLFKQIHGEKYAVIVDGDNGDERKQIEKVKIKSKCDSDGALFKQLSKREIENFCPPEKIKECYISEIRSKEGAESINPRITKIDKTTLTIDDDTDVEKYLKDQGINGFKNGMNIKVFESMDISDWESVDGDNEIKTFLESVYERIER
ncbi:MAG: AAA family ATPase [Chlorobi bacterium]|nr:AAA family ATPase [Chlorobiota bacterium]